jgi:hypothetical protein
MAGGRKSQFSVLDILPAAAAAAAKERDRRSLQEGEERVHLSLSVFPEKKGECFVAAQKSFVSIKSRSLPWTNNAAILYKMRSQTAKREGAHSAL